MITTEMDTLREAIEEAGDSELREAAKELLSKAEELERDNNKLSDDNDSLELENRELKNRSDSLRHMRQRYPGLFFGDLNKLNDCDRQDLFQAVADLEISSGSRHDSEAERTLARFDGMLR